MECSEMIDKNEIVPTLKPFHQQNSSGPSKNDEERHCATDLEPKKKKNLSSLLRNRNWCSFHIKLPPMKKGLKKTMMPMNYKKPYAERQKLPSVSQKKKDKLSERKNQRRVNDEAMNIYKNQVIDLKKQMEKQEEFFRRQMEKLGGEIQKPGGALQKAEGALQKRGGALQKPGE